MSWPAVEPTTLHCARTSDLLMRKVCATKIGNARWWNLRYPCGCELGIELTEGLGGPMLSVRSNDPDLAHVLHHLHAADWKSDEVLPIERWSVFRQDDNGGRFHIRDFDSKFSAECARRTFEARGHKQLYTIEIGS